jgi:hypothetical protein
VGGDSSLGGRECGYIRRGRRPLALSRSRVEVPMRRTEALGGYLWIAIEVAASITGANGRGCVLHGEPQRRPDPGRSEPVDALQEEA